MWTYWISRKGEISWKGDGGWYRKWEGVMNDPHYQLCSYNGNNWLIWVKRPHHRNSMHLHSIRASNRSQDVVYWIWSIFCIVPNTFSALRSTSSITLPLLSHEWWIEDLSKSHNHNEMASLRPAENRHYIAKLIGG